MNRDQEPCSDPWEASLDRALKKLPDREAPGMLIPRVMRAIEARARAPWYQRPWWQWPFPLRVGSVGGCVGLLLAVMWLIGFVADPGWGIPFAAWADAARGWFDALAGAAESVLAAVALITPERTHFALLWFALVVTLMYLTCVGIGAVVYQVAWRKL